LFFIDFFGKGPKCERLFEKWAEATWTRRLRRRLATLGTVPGCWSFIGADCELGEDVGPAPPHAAPPRKMQLKRMPTKTITRSDRRRGISDVMKNGASARAAVSEAVREAGQRYG
jgi:hypothetical protein